MESAPAVNHPDGAPAEEQKQSREQEQELFSHFSVHPFFRGFPPRPLNDRLMTSPTRPLIYLNGQAFRKLTAGYGNWRKRGRGKRKGDRNRF
jgi:hypothetical protein